MQEKTKKHFEKYWSFYVLFLIIIISIFLRSWHFQETLYFNLDQARDAELIRNAHNEGIGKLPLLGPRAAGTFLRLGPIYYYFQYSSSVIFQSVEPYVFAYPDLFFSILTIPLVYFFCRQIFSKKTSLMVTSLFSFSFIIIQYSRFAWNTNSIPFWALLFLLGLYKASNVSDKKKAGLWLVLVALGYSVVSQLHFIALLGFPVVAISFWIFYFPKKINWKFWILSIFILFFFYSPMIVSEIKTGGYNAEQFLFALTEKKEGDNNDSFFHSLIKKETKIAGDVGMIISSIDADNEKNYYAGNLLIAFGIILLIFKWKNLKEQRSFVFLVLAWFILFIGLLLITDTSLKARFVLPIAVVPFLFVGLIFDFIQKRKKGGWKIASLTFIGLVALLIFVNINGVLMWYKYLEKQDSRYIKRDLFLKQSDGATLGKMNEAVDYMASKALKENGNICYNSKNEYVHVYEYLIVIHYPEINQFRIKKDLANKDDCSFFSVVRAGADNKISSKYVNYFNFAESKKFGLIEVWNLDARENFLSYGKEEDEEKKTEEDIDIEEENVSRKDRVFWGDIF